MIHIGHGYDVHRLTRSRRLILGGVEIDYDLGLDGHSDADVLCHSVIDALLGAAALGDIGMHFPETDDSYADADSIELLKRVTKLLFENGWQIVNIDTTVIAQRPRLSGFVWEMRKRLASACSVSVSSVSVKATTEEGLGFTGTEEGIASHAVCLIETII